jgi:SWI/SNF related-matrix-associated actin-dependent regulator of chromatin subfamily C
VLTSCLFIEQKAGQLSYPKVMLSSTVPAKHAPKLKAIVKAHKGVLVTSSDEATHVVVKDAPRDTAEDPALDYLRTLEVKGKQALVHWWYYPDSYDTWLPASEVEGEAPPQEEHKGPWIVVRTRAREILQEAKG